MNPINEEGPLSFETELRDRLRAGVSDLDVDLIALIAAALDDGSRRRRRRRLTGGLAVIAVLVGLGCTAYALRPDPPTPPVAGTPTSAASSPMIPEDILQILRELLPPTAQISDYAGGWSGDESARSPYGSLMYGADTKLVLSLSNQPLDPRSCNAPITVLRCEPTKLANGATLTRFDGHDKTSGDRLWEIRLHRSDGLTITLDQFAKTKTPALSITTMRRIVQDPRWRG